MEGLHVVAGIEIAVYCHEHNDDCSLLRTEVLHAVAGFDMAVYCHKHSDDCGFLRTEVLCVVAASSPLCSAAKFSSVVVIFGWKVSDLDSSRYSDSKISTCVAIFGCEASNPVLYVRNLHDQNLCIL